MLLALAAVSACGSSGSTLPSAPSRLPAAVSDARAAALAQAQAIDVLCSESILVGERGSCAALARTSPVPIAITLDATWSSSRPEVAAPEVFGLVAGRSVGEAVITATYRGLQASAVMRVRLEDALRTGAVAIGSFQPGTRSLWLSGFYTVASAESAQLRLEVTDQSGAVITTTSRTVSRGGDQFTFDHTFAVPTGTTRICWTAILDIGPLRLTQPTGDSPPTCTTVVG
jgi:hypothetical protein